jgi:hypothetical protein
MTCFSLKPRAKATYARPVFFLETGDISSTEIVSCTDPNWPGFKLDGFSVFKLSGGDPTEEANSDDDDDDDIDVEPSTAVAALEDGPAEAASVAGTGAATANWASS